MSSPQVQGFFVAVGGPYPPSPRAGRNISSHAAKGLFGANILSTFFLYAYRAKHSRVETPWWYAALHPIGACVLAYAMLRSACTTIASGCIEWRGTRYPLGSLKENAL